MEQNKQFMAWCLFFLVFRLHTCRFCKYGQTFGFLSALFILLYFFAELNSFYLLDLQSFFPGYIIWTLFMLSSIHFKLFQQQNYFSGKLQAPTQKNQVEAELHSINVMPEPSTHHASRTTPLIHKPPREDPGPLSKSAGSPLRNTRLSVLLSD